MSLPLFHGSRARVVILNPDDYGTWLSCSIDDAPQFLKQWHGSLDVFKGYPLSSAWPTITL